MTAWDIDTDNVREYCGRQVICHSVSVLSHSMIALYAAQLPHTGRVLIYCDRLSHWDDRVSTRRVFKDGRAAASWLKASDYLVPADFVRALRENSLGAPHIWPARVSDILGLRRKTYTAWWSLSYETHDEGNDASFETLSEAYSCLGEVGALMAIPGNCGSISIGGVTLYSTHFRSDGIDPGDSHVNPSMQTSESDLFEQIRAFEREGRASYAGWRNSLVDSKVEVL